jgi:pyruvate dehydrogenase E2 component (dihydrolipoamide acetyltransferase)
VVEVKVPDIGDFDAVPIIELFVKVGDTIKAEDAIVTLESDKATMDVPSSAAGVVKEVLVKLGDTVSEGTVLIRVRPWAPLLRHRPLRRPPPRAPTFRRPMAHLRPHRRCRPRRLLPSAPSAVKLGKARTPARRCVPSPANWVSISPRSRAPARRTASSRKTSAPSSRAP